MLLVVTSWSHKVVYIGTHCVIITLSTNTPETVMTDFETTAIKMLNDFGISDIKFTNVPRAWGSSSVDPFTYFVTGRVHINIAAFDNPTTEDAVDVVTRIMKVKWFYTNRPGRLSKQQKTERWAQARKWAEMKVAMFNLTAA